MTLEKLRQLSDKELNERFPFMVCHKAFIDENDKDDLVRDENGNVVNHFEDWGWRDIQLALAEHVKPIYDNMSNEEKECFSVSQIKEKFGEYTHYWQSSNDAVDLWTMLAEYVSSYTCIECGKTVSTVKSADEPDRLIYTYYESQGWICPYCKDHKREDREYAQKFKSDRFTFIRGVPFAPEQQITLRVEDFWKLPEED